MRERTEEQKQARDNIAAYTELVRWDNWGLPESKITRQFENLIVRAHNEQTTGKLPDFETVVAYYSQRYGFPYLPPKLSQAELNKRQAQMIADDKARYKAQDRQRSREHVKVLQQLATEHGFVEMTFGGSHRSYKKIRALIKQEGIRTGEYDYQASTHNYKRRSIDVHKDDVEKARKIGMSVRKG